MRGVLTLEEDLKIALRGFSRFFRHKTEGIILYFRGDEKDFLYKDGIVVTASGSKQDGSYRPEPRGNEILERVLRENPDIRYAHFHTHTLSLAERVGIENLAHFSEKDKEELIKHWNTGRCDYGLLANPAGITALSKNGEVQIDYEMVYEDQKGRKSKACRIFRVINSDMPANELDEVITDFME